MNVGLLAESIVAGLFQPAESSRWSYRASRPVSAPNTNSSDVASLLRERLVAELIPHGYVIEEILQVNLDARKIVAACRSQDGRPAVAKWHDDSEVGTYAFAKNHLHSEVAHFKLASTLPNAIPKGILLHKNLLLLEAVGGHAIINEWRLNPDYRKNLAERLAQSIGEIMLHLKLKEVAGLPQGGNAKILSERLAWLASYGLHLKSSPGALGIVHGLFLPSNAQKRHAALVRAFISEGNRIAAKIDPVWSSRDLDELNIHVDETHIHIVDWDSAGATFASIEFAMLASRLVALAIIYNDSQVASEIVSCFQRRLCLVAPLEDLLFLITLRLHILHLQINPWMWPNASSFTLRQDSAVKRVSDLRRLQRWSNGEWPAIEMASFR